MKEKPLQDIKNKEYLSIADACKLLGLSRWTIWRAIKKRELTAAKIGRTTIIQRTAIDKLFALQPLNTGPKEPAQHTFNADYCYTISQVLSLYTISEKALYDVIKRNNITKHKQGRISYVSKSEIDIILTNQLKR
ncbi:helix-turn-helix domain-containing protein [Pontibacter roseus]|uniref:helix-turn-helix domain-containing protein n=1 Tax=Pontibacter roseus TaxID=336989 RepID=UPI001FDFD6BC|nr:helix-turn-helix domain-containing protein [Pontibacter roseus]